MRLGILWEKDLQRYVYAGSVGRCLRKCKKRPSWSIVSRGRCSRRREQRSTFLLYVKCQQLAYVFRAIHHPRYIEDHISCAATRRSRQALKTRVSSPSPSMHDMYPFGICLARKFKTPPICSPRAPFSTTISPPTCTADWCAASAKIRMYLQNSSHVHQKIRSHHLRRFQ
jgi:hypothetical protein